MKVLKNFFLISELFFSMATWLFIYVIYFSFSWFFNEPVGFMTYLFPFVFLLFVYLGYLTVPKSYTLPTRLNKRINLLLPALIGFIPVCIFFVLNLNNLGKGLSEIREEHLDQMSGDFKDTIYNLLFPLMIFAFIIANFNNKPYKIIINILVTLSCLAFIPINGGRVNFIIFGCIYLSIYLFKNFEKIKKSYFKYFLRLTLLLLFVSLFGAVFTILRTGAEGDAQLVFLSKLPQINNDALNSLSKSEYGVALVFFINTFYDYTGGNVYYLDIFIDNFEKIPYRTYGFYNFNFLDRFGIINWMQTHNDIDRLYYNYDINYNVWATSIRDLSIDFGILGTFLFVFLLARLLFISKAFLNKSYSAQIVFFMTFSFFLFAPFHSMFYLTKAYGVGFLVAFVLFVRFRLMAKPMNKLINMQPKCEIQESLL